MSYKKRKKFPWKFFVFIVCAILGGIFLLSYRLRSAFYVLYGPPPIDERLQINEKKQLQPALYGPPSIEVRQRQKDKNKQSNLSEPE